MTGVAIHWFEIPVTDLGRAAIFYGDVLGIALGDMEGPAGPMKTFQNGDTPIGALVSSEHNSPSTTGPLVYFGAEDIDSTLERVNTAGGQVVLSKTSIGDHGNIAQFVDTEGNRIALHGD